VLLRHFGVIPFMALCFVSTCFLFQGFKFAYFVTSSDYVIISVVFIESGEVNLVLKLNSNLRNSFRVGGN